MNKLIYMEYEQARNLIKEADVLLFRGRGLVARFIGRAGEGVHTHVAVASWHGNSLECVEFREWKGGRTVNLSIQVEKNNGYIDVYRPLSSIHYPVLVGNEIIYSLANLDPYKITNCMRDMTGLPYGWKRIWLIAKHKMPFVRFFYDIGSVTKDLGEILYPICSTAVAHCFSKNYYDLVKNRADQWTEPADISRSSILSYLFTLKIGA